jgi:hypothetical protein
LLGWLFQCFHGLLCTRQDEKVVIIIKANKSIFTLWFMSISYSLSKEKKN